MGADVLIGTQEEHVAARAIEQACMVLAGLSGEIPHDFAARLFARAAPEDVVRYEPREIAHLAFETWAFLAVRKPGVPKIRFESPAATAGARLKTISVIEIVNDDMPFLVDSVMGQLTETGLEVRLVAHPIFTVEREPSGALAGLHGENLPGPTAHRESVIHIHVERVEDETRRNEVVAALGGVLAQVRRAVEDWRPMLARVKETIAGMRSAPPPLAHDELLETIQFLEWLTFDNFTFLGVQDLVLENNRTLLAPAAETALGVLRVSGGRVLPQADASIPVTPRGRAFLDQPGALIITKDDARSLVHRRVAMDFVGLKRYAADRTVTGLFRIVGLFTSTAYTRSSRSIPYLRRKIDAVLSRAGFDPEGHSGKALVNVLETYPRDELFQIDEDTLYHFAIAILQLEERPRVRVLPRRDRFGRFVSVLVYVPRERYDSATRAAIGKLLADSYGGIAGFFTPFFPEGPLVRVNFMIGRAGRDLADPDRAGLERAVAALVRTWSDTLAEALALAHDPGKAHVLIERYRDAFSAGYREAYAPNVAVADIRVIETLSADRPLGVDFHRRSAEGDGAIGLKVWSHARPIPLSERVPVLEHMGFKVVDERTYHVTPRNAGAPGFWLHDMLLAATTGVADVQALKSRLETCFLRVMRGLAENDGYNALVLAAGLPWRDVALVRAISRYLRQVRVPYSQDYMWATLGRHGSIVARIVALFHIRFDPRFAVEAGERAAREARLIAEIEAALQTVESLDEDRILRRFLNAVQSALRTNFYQLGSDGQPKPVLAIKFDSRKVEGMALPRPLYEIFVYSPRVEGIHLRFGKVARGGIRWSDRPQDFRTEVLGLVKAQQVKNAVIVPVGAKGGFVPKRLPIGNRDAAQAEGVAAYKTFISTLLDITDNLGPEGVIPPGETVRYDDDDPYLVVAADKGTATFSDVANTIAQEHGFWLDDAFASGGSAGYDHKKMGITARGAWESVKRHFREMDVDISRTPFTVAGVGDMSGDVFGNGMLRERTIRLVAAFDHRDIFIDPDPDPARSFAERQRLFDLPRSSWRDYDPSLISKGGGVYPRSAKDVPLSPEAQALLGIGAEKPTPQEVMSAILRLPVDLLWFGGIGTYVRASDETDDAVGDRANDAIRVSGAELRCKVIGEGANLGMTQRGRIEAALRGIRLNTDAIDNSAGVNTSDVEVNLKIALSRPCREGRLKRGERNALLSELTDEVARLVLRNNYQQTLALSLAERRGMEDLGFHQRLMQTLEARGLLDRAVEFLPDDMEIAERRRRGQPLTRPELAVLLSYAKLALHGDLLASRVPDDAYLSRELERYFPHAISERFPDAVEHHRLRREIISTQLANSMVNRGGPSFGVRVADQTGAGPDRIAAAFAAVRDSYGMTAINTAIEELDNRVPGQAQLALFASVQDLLLDRVVWFLRNVDVATGLAGVVDHYRSGIAALAKALDEVLPPEAAAARAARRSELKAAGVPGDLACRLADLPNLGPAPDIALVADRTGRAVADVASTYFAAEALFRLDRITAAARGIVISDYFDRLALDRALDSIGEAQRRLTVEMIAGGAAGPAAVEAWLARRAEDVARIRGAIHEIAGSGLTLSKLSVAASLLGDLAAR
ncbi:MAG TPA: NAD-glutamate dehydrogenase [Xanthobacteraceae bacterium]|nr:NAD-glutamate dehydrogenase [Xanthobacteraceae bacterium]